MSLFKYLIKIFVKVEFDICGVWAEGGGVGSVTLRTSNEELKCSTSLPNFVTSSVLPKESRGAADPTEMKLEDIEESPSQSSQGEGGASTPTNDTTPTMTKATKFFKRHREQNCSILSYSACD